jgi:hypothetical protein
VDVKDQPDQDCSGTATGDVAAARSRRRTLLVGPYLECQHREIVLR